MPVVGHDLSCLGTLYLPTKPLFYQIRAFRKMQAAKIKRERETGAKALHPSEADGRVVDWRPFLLEIGRKASVMAFGRKIWHLEPP